MTDKTRAVMVRLPVEIVEWMESKESKRAAIEEMYEGMRLDLSGFYEACDAKEIDYQLAINRMVELINED